MCPKHDDDQCTLEELCWAIWRQDEKGYRQMADREWGSLRCFIRQFEREGQVYEKFESDHGKLPPHR